VVALVHPSFALSTGQRKIPITPEPFHLPTPALPSHPLQKHVFHTLLSIHFFHMLPPNQQILPTMNIPFWHEVQDLLLQQAGTSFVHFPLV
jgi:hypothetical protein